MCGRGGVGAGVGSLSQKLWGGNNVVGEGHHVGSPALRQYSLRVCRMNDHKVTAAFIEKEDGRARQKFRRSRSSRNKGEREEPVRVGAGR